MSNTVSVSEMSNSVVVVEADNTVTVTQADNTVTVTAPAALRPGGATNDILVKQSATDYDIAWQDTAILDKIGFDTTAAESLTVEGEMAWDADFETVDVLLRNGSSTPTLMHIGQDEFFWVKASATITRGQVVYYTGTDGASGHILAAPFLADGTHPSKTVIGVATQDAATGEFIHVLWRGKLRSFDTSLLTPGILYASSTVAGGFQSTQPVAPNNIVTIAVAVNQKSNGTIIVRPTFAGSLAESEDVALSSPAAGEVLTYNGTTWQNAAAGVPTGGATGQVLVKASATDYDTGWTTPRDAPGLPSTNISGQTYMPMGWGFIGTTTTWVHTVDTKYYTPIILHGAWTITSVAVSISSAAAATSKAIVALYAADSAWQPTTLVAQTAEIAVDSTGIKTANISASGTSGRYLLMFHSNGTPTLRIRYGTSPIGPLNTQSLSDGFQVARRVSEAYSSTASSPGASWTTVSTNNTDFTSILLAGSVT